MPGRGWEAKGRCVRHSHLAQSRAGKVMFRGEETILQIDIVGRIQISEGRYRNSLQDHSSDTYTIKSYPVITEIKRWGNPDCSAEAANPTEQRR